LSKAKPRCVMRRGAAQVAVKQSRGSFLAVGSAAQTGQIDQFFKPTTHYPCAFPAIFA
jgi:hypothetical protein